MTKWPIRMVDVVREVRATAERAEDPEMVAARRRAQSPLARLPNDFVEDLIGDTERAERAA